MSSIIDQIAFSNPANFTKHIKDKQKSGPLSLLFKNFVLLELSSKGKQQWIQRQSIQMQQFQIKIHRIKQTNNFAIKIIALEQSHYKMIKSKHHEILLLKQIAKRSSTIPIQSIYFVHRSCLVMTVKFVFDKIEETKINLMTQFYNQIISKNLLQFWIFTKKFLYSEIKNTEVDTISSFHLELAISQMLNTTTSNFQLSEEKTQYKYASDSFALQKKQIDKLNQNIVKSDGSQKIVQCLFHAYPEEATADWIKSNFLKVTESLHKKFKPLLTLVRSKEDRRIQQFTFNMVKVQISNILKKEIGEGGSSYIYIAKAFLTFINSTDHNTYMQKDEKIEKLIAIKKLKPGLENKLREKLSHEKSIVSTLKGGTSLFIPKYYGTEQGLDISSSLLMQLVQGEELNGFIEKRQCSISLWSKLYLLLNIVHGIRHLINYEIVHLDLKPMNIMVCRYLITKILDFGEAYSKEVCDNSYCPGYTFPYAAPQILQRFHRQNKKTKNKQPFEYTQKQDVFAFGIIMAEVLFNTKIFYLSNDAFKSVYLKKQMLNRVMMAIEELQSYGDQTALSTLAFIIVRCLDPDPQRRPYFDWVGIALKLILNSYSIN